MTKTKVCKQLPLVVVVTVLFLAGFFVFHNYKSTMSEVEQTALFDSNSETKWNTFSGSKIEYSIDYPEGWKIEENYGGDNMLHFFAINNSGGYQLKYSPLRTLTGICLFDDTNSAELKAGLEKDFPGYFDQASIKLEQYTGFGDYRRSTHEGKIIVCKDWQETGFEYMLPPSPDQKIITQMDKMVQSFNWVGTVLN